MSSFVSSCDSKHVLLSFSYFSTRWTDLKRILQRLVDAKASYPLIFFASRFCWNQIDACKKKKVCKSRNRPPAFILLLWHWSEARNETAGLSVSFFFFLKDVATASCVSFHLRVHLRDPEPAVPWKAVPQKRGRLLLTVSLRISFQLETPPPCDAPNFQRGAEERRNRWSDATAVF